MHNTIFEIEDYIIDEDNYYTGDDVPEWFTLSIADYAITSDDREGDIGWLRNILGDSYFNIDGNKIVFFDGFKENFFKDKYIRFSNISEELSKYSLEDFINDEHGYIDMKLSLLSSCYSDRHGIYTKCDKRGFETLSDFVRHIEYNKPYYIGGTVDYHF